VREVNVASPTCHNGIRLDSSVVMFLEEAKECFAHFWEGKASFCSRVVNE